MKKKQCCEDFNGIVDMTNSCIFCKTYLPKKKAVKEFSNCCEMGLYQLNGELFCKGCNIAFNPESTHKPLESTQKSDNLHKQITITNNWLERLIFLSKELEDLLKKSDTDARKTAQKYRQLAGYISSAEELLK